MAQDDIGPIPAGLLVGIPESEVASTTEWLNNVLAVTQRSQTTEQEGRSLKMPAQANSTAPDVATLVSDFNALLAKLRTAGKMEESP